jgi:hypothetical protein
MKKSICCFILAAVAMAFPATVRAQGVSNLYAAGLSYNGAGTPAVAGSALYAHAVSPDMAPGMYAFSVIDVLPNNVKPFTVSTNIGAGIAQRVFTIGTVPIFIPTAAGISISGTNTGWAWTTGAAASFKLKWPNWYLVPTARLLKSSVGNGTGYQPILGLMIAWGK